MEGYLKLVSDFSSVHWWVSVVVVGVLINLSSGVIQNFIGKFWTSYRVKNLDKARREKAESDRRVEVYIRVPILMSMDFTIVVAAMLFGLGCMIFSLVSFAGNASIFFSFNGTSTTSNNLNPAYTFFWACITAVPLALGLAFVRTGLKLIKPIKDARRVIFSAANVVELSDRR